MQKRRVLSTHSLLLALLGVFLLAVTNLSFGQDVNASLSGTVTDPSGAAIPGAKMTLTNEATGFKANFISDAAGEYSFHNLTPGKYDMNVTANGFKTTDQKGIELAVSQAARIDVKLPLGKTDETVTVIGDASLINYENQTLEGGVSPEALQDFPLVVSGAPRSSVAVATMMPGVTSAGGNNAFNARINGGIITGDEAIVDGVTTSEGYMNQSGMVALQTDFGMSPDITSEVHVLTADYDASTATPPPASSSSRPRAAAKTSTAAGMSTSATTSSTPTSSLARPRPPASADPRTRKTTSAHLSAAPGTFPASMARTHS
jgi:hypothetical protein